MRIILLFFILTSVVYAQDNKQKKAYQYFQKGEYEQAILIYKDLEKVTSITTYYYSYFTSYFNLGQYKKARILSKKMTKKFPSSLIYLVDVNACYLKEKNMKTTKK